MEIFGSGHSKARETQENLLCVASRRISGKLNEVPYDLAIVQYPNSQ